MRNTPSFSFSSQSVSQSLCLSCLSVVCVVSLACQWPCHCRLVVSCASCRSRCQLLQCSVPSPVMDHPRRLSVSPHGPLSFSVTARPSGRTTRCHTVRVGRARRDAAAEERRLSEAQAFSIERCCTNCSLSVFDCSSLLILHLQCNSTFFLCHPRHTSVTSLLLPVRPTPI